jgi:signal transduction histidine kinase
MAVAGENPTGGGGGDGVEDAEGAADATRTAPERFRGVERAIDAVLYDAERAPEAVLRDEQSLLSATVQRLRDALRCQSVVAWALREDGSCYVPAACFEGPPPEAPSAEVFAAAGSLRQTTLLEPSSAPPELVGLARLRAAVAVAPVVTSAGRPLAVLMVTARDSEALRPRALAVIETAAHRIAAPLAAADGARRLGRLDGEIRRLDRLSALGTLAAEIAHEVRNPMVSVKTFLQLLPERRNDPEFVEDFLAVATEELHRIERLLDLVIEYPRGSDPEPRASTGAVLESIGELLRHVGRGRGIELKVVAGDELPDVAVSGDSLRQVLLNLALNAVEATPPDGTVRLSAGLADGGVDVTVDDEGPGIPDDERERVFEPFHSTRPGAHGGIGLALSRRMVEEAGGSVRIEDAPDGGARLRVHLPAAR